MPAYMQLYHRLKNDVTTQSYPFGSRLPSKRALAEMYSLSLATVIHALTLLEEEGYIQSKERSGFFVTYRQDQVMTGPEEILTSIPEETPERTGEELPFSAYARAMRSVLSTQASHLMEKSPNSGVPALREAISAYLRTSRSIQADPRQIIIGAGAEYLYTLIVQLLGRDRIFALEDPGYPMIRQVYEAQGVVCDMLKMGREGILTRSLLSTEATVLHVTPFHSFPTGITAPASKRLEYLRFSRDHNGYIIEDDYDGELTASTKAEDTLFAMDPDRRVLHINTFSKTLAPSLRVGYLLLPERLMDAFQARCGFYSCTVPVTEQYVIAELIRSGEFVRHINRVRRMRRKNPNQDMSDLVRMNR